MLLNFNPRSPHGERHGERGADVYLLAFQSTLPARGATPVLMAAARGTDISIHAPRTGSDEISALAPSDREISIHAPRTGSDGCAPEKAKCLSRFQSTLPARGATRQATETRRSSPFQSTLPARGATRSALGSPENKRFQSTLPARGATFPRRRTPHHMGHFNPRSPHGERRRRHFLPQIQMYISIHAPRTGSDVAIRDLSRGGDISIHAPRTGSDVCISYHREFPKYFNPRSPHGERRAHRPSFGATWQFQSTLPARGATFVSCSCNCYRQISIHAPRTGSDITYVIK